MTEKLSIKTKSLLINSSLCVGMFVVILAVFYFFPVSYVYMISEDTWAEYATTTAFLAGAALLFWTMIRQRSARTIVNAALLLFMVFVGMEEISWGQRIFGIATPDYFMEANHQRELNLHNLHFVKYTKMLFHNGVAFWLVLSWIGWERLGPLGRLLNRLKAPSIPSYTAPYFLLALVFALFGIIPKSEELNELIFAYGFAFLSMDIYYETRPADIRDRLHIAPSFLLTGSIMASALFLSVCWPWPQALSHRMNLFAAREYPKLNLHGQAEKVYAYLLKNPSLRNPDTLYNYGMYRRERGDEAGSRSLLAMAVEENRERIEKGPAAGADWFRMATFYRALSSPAEERQALLKAIELYTGEIRGLEEGIRSGNVIKKLAERNLNQAYYNIAEAYEKTGRKDRAQKYREAAAALKM